MIERSLDCFGFYPAKLIGDTAYGSAEMLNWLVHGKGIEPHIPVFDKSQHTDGTFSRDDFTYDHDRDCYICPAGKELRQRQKIYRMPRPLVDRNGMMRYRASKVDCQGCSLKPRCCPNAAARKIPRSIHEGARDMARAIAKTEAYRTFQPRTGANAQTSRTRRLRGRPQPQSRTAAPVLFRMRS